MVLVPILCRDNFVEDFFRPSCAMERRLFGDGFPGTFLMAIDQTPAKRRCNRTTCACSEQQKSTESKQNNDGFLVNIDVQQFAPEEISVKMTGDNYITVEAKHEEKQDDLGFISRHFVRKYRLPEGHDGEKVESSLSSDGVLTIKAPKLALPEPKETERTIPVVRTEKPAVQDKQDDLANSDTNGMNTVE